jgi:hypothetical protein
LFSLPITRKPKSRIQTWIDQVAQCSSFHIGLIPPTNWYWLVLAYIFTASNLSGKFLSLNIYVLKHHGKVLWSFYSSAEIWTHDLSLGWQVLQYLSLPAWERFLFVCLLALFHWLCDKGDVHTTGNWESVTHLEKPMVWCSCQELAQAQNLLMYVLGTW